MTVLEFVFFEIIFFRIVGILILVVEILVSEKVNVCLLKIKIKVVRSDFF